MEIIFVLGYANVGKTSFIKKLCSKCNIHIPKHLTTRPQREDDLYYEFVSAENFQKTSMFIKASDKHGRMYGVSTKEITECKYDKIIINCSIKNLPDLIENNNYNKYKVCILTTNNPKEKILNNYGKYSKKEMNYRVKEALYEKTIVESYMKEIKSNKNFYLYSIEKKLDIDESLERFIQDAKI